MKSSLILFIFLPLAILSCRENRQKKQKAKPTDFSTKKQSIAHNPDVEIIFKGDSLTILGSGITHDPFDFGGNPLEKLTSFSTAQINKTPQQNRHIKNQIDTIYTIRIGKNFFEVYKTPSKRLLEKANIRSSLFRTRHGIYVGMDKATFQKHLKAHHLKTIPAYVLLKNREVNEWMGIGFQNDTISEIRFNGYVD